MISDIGMDLKFLEVLRERDRVVLCSNLPSIEYQNCAWMYSVLSDQRTLYRKSRTPQFFQSVLRRNGFDLEAERERLESEIKEKMPWDVAVKTIALLNPGQSPESMDQYARLLSHRITRIAATWDFDECLNIRENFTSDPLNASALINPLQLCATNVVSGGLGGKFHRVSGTQLRIAFPDTFNEFEVMKADFPFDTASDEVLNFLAEYVVPGDVSDIYNPAVWAGMNEDTRSDLLFRLSSDAHMMKDRRVIDDARRAIVNADTESLGNMRRVLEDAATRVDEKFKLLDWVVTVSLAIPAAISGEFRALGIPAAWKAMPESPKKKLLSNFIAGYDIVDLMKRRPDRSKLKD